MNKIIIILIAIALVSGCMTNGNSPQRAKLNLVHLLAFDTSDSAVGGRIIAILYKNKCAYLIDGGIMSDVMISSEKKEVVLKEIKNDELLKSKKILYYDESTKNEGFP